MSSAIFLVHTLKDSCTLPQRMNMTTVITYFFEIFPREEWPRKPNRRTKVKPENKIIVLILYICSEIHKNINRILVISKNGAISWKMPEMAETKSNFIPFPLHRIDILLEIVNICFSLSVITWHTYKPNFTRKSRQLVEKKRYYSPTLEQRTFTRIRKNNNP